MAYRFQILGSSSGGNSALLETPGGRILVDAGFSGRRTEAILEQAGLGAEDIQAVFLTHDHHDHACGVRGLSRYGHLEFYANLDTAGAIRRKLNRPVNWKIFQSGQAFRYGDLEVWPLPIPHDAYDPVGFLFRWGGDDLFNPAGSLAWINDLGHVPRALMHRLREVDTLVIEANHDEAMLDKDSRRPPSVKQRIRGRHGHLSNHELWQVLQESESPRWRNLCLSHLSRDCNDPHMVADLFAALPVCQSGQTCCRVINPDDVMLEVELPDAFQLLENQG